MLITVVNISGTLSKFQFGNHSAIDKMVAAIKENIPDWHLITVTIVNKED